MAWKPEYETRRLQTSTTIYFPPAMYRWLKDRAVTERTSLTKLVNRYCEEGRIRDELADTVGQDEADLTAVLDKIKGKIEQRREEHTPGNEVTQ